MITYVLAKQTPNLIS